MPRESALLKQVQKELEKLGYRDVYNYRDYLIVQDVKMEKVVASLLSKGWDRSESFITKNVKYVTLEQNRSVISLTQRIFGNTNRQLTIKLDDNETEEIDTTPDLVDGMSRGIDTRDMLFMGGSFVDRRTGEFITLEASVENKRESDQKEVLSRDKSKELEKLQNELQELLTDIQNSMEQQNDRIGRELDILQKDLEEKFKNLEKVLEKVKDNSMKANVNKIIILDMLDKIQENLSDKFESIKNQVSNKKL